VLFDDVSPIDFDLLHDAEDVLVLTAQPFEKQFSIFS